MCSCKVVCVFNNEEIFNKVVKNNENLSGCEIFAYDNSCENIPITKRYNDFIQENIDEKSDLWVVFMHQDFGFMQELQPMLKKLNKKYIYGPIGVNLYKGLFWGKRPLKNDRGFKTHLTLAWGRILQGNNDFNFTPKGRRVLFTKTVDAVDCCCIMVHSSLINKFNLRFDENLSFHMYAEELCYRAKNEHKIKTKVVQMKCFHLGAGTLNEEYFKSVEYLKKKFNISKIPSTCPN